MIRDNDPDFYALDLVRIWRNMISTNCVGNVVDDDGARALAEALSFNDTLLRVNLGGYKLGDEAAANLAASLRRNVSITDLDLSYNCLGGGAIAFAIRDNRTIARLDLSGNYLGNGGAAAIAEGLRRNVSVRVLDLSRNQIGNDGARALADALLCNLTLVSLDLSTNEIGAEGKIFLARATRIGGARIILDGIEDAEKAIVVDRYCDLRPEDRTAEVKTNALGRAFFSGRALPRLSLRSIGGVGRHAAAAAGLERKGLAADVHRAGLERVVRASGAVEDGAMPLVVERVGETIGLASIFEIVRLKPELFTF